MKKIELKMSDNFYKYILKTIPKQIDYKKIIAELLKNDNIKKPYNLKISECNIKDLKGFRPLLFCLYNLAQNIILWYTVEEVIKWKKFGKK